jgi:hypothetical protein
MSFLLSHEGGFELMSVSVIFIAVCVKAALNMHVTIACLLKQEPDECVIL